jgi:Rha family phage regulatory protein
MGFNNFVESSCRNSQNKEQPIYELSRDGFSILVMGFTVAKAAGEVSLSP